MDNIYNAYTCSTPCLGLRGDLRAFIGDAFFYKGSFRTLSAFRRFCRRFSLMLIPGDTRQGASGYPVSSFRLKEIFSEHLFWNLSELPAGVRRFRALSNGSIVWCWWRRNGNDIEIWRPNPNAKNVYRPLPLEKHIAFQKRNGIY